MNNPKKYLDIIIGKVFGKKGLFLILIHFNNFKFNINTENFTNY